MYTLKICDLGWFKKTDWVVARQDFCLREDAGKKGTDTESFLPDKAGKQHGQYRLKVKKL